MARYWQGSRVKRSANLQTPVLDAQGVETGTFRNCRVRNSELNEALGQISYIFSDKEGTLTQDSLKLVKIMVGRYVFCDDELPKKVDQDDLRDLEFTNLMKVEGIEGDKARNTLRCMALCHNVLYDNDINFYSSCAEELEFVKFADDYNYKFLVPENDHGRVNYMLSENGESKAYIFLEKFEFTEARDKISIIVQYDDDIIMYTKGSLKAIKLCLDLTKSPDLEVIENNTNQLLERGFIVVAFAYKKISLNDWNAFIDNYYKETSKQENRDKVLELQEQFENGLNLIGAGVLTEKLQEDVENNINFIKGAGIKFWILTSGTTNTTVHLCKKMNLISENTENIILSQSSEIKEVVYKEILKKLKTKKKGKAILCTIEGQYYSVIENYKETNVVLYEQFREIVLKCESAVFTKLTPFQKKSIIRMVKEFDTKAVTLAIGDSPEDVYMLNEADVSIGIEGQCGIQAAYAADYALGEFKHIIPLVFYFGRETYRKNSKLMLHLFYMSMLAALPNFWYGFFNFFSPRLIYDSVLYHAFPVLFGFIPIIYFAVFDKTYTKQRMLFSPLLYMTGLDDFYFNIHRFLTTLCFGWGVSLYITLIAIMFFDWGNYENGYFFGFWNFGNMCLCGSVFISNLKIWIISSSYSSWQFILMILCVGFYFGVWFLLDRVESSVLYLTFWEVIKGKQFYYFLIVLACIAIFEYLYEKMFYNLRERKYEPDFEVRFDANIQMSQADGEELDLALSGISDHKKEKLDKYNKLKDDEEEEYDVFSCEEDEEDEEDDDDDEKKMV